MFELPQLFQRSTKIRRMKFSTDGELDAFRPSLRAQSN
jgi:hypothetical protein